MKIRHALAVIALATCSAFAAGSVSNLVLRELMNQDQAVRSGTADSIDWKKVVPQDAERRKRTMEIMKTGGLRTSEDYYNAALIFQHGDSAEDIKLAYSLATVAVTLDPDNKPAKWLTAAAWDRIMMRLGKPQWYGTQSFKPNGSDKWELYTIDEKAVSDEERKAYGVPSVKESRRRAESFH